MKRLELLDYGRFLAALGVVFFHYTFDAINKGRITSVTLDIPLAEISKHGYFGVHLFFMISGYVIFFSAKNRTASQFLVSRITKLYPLFWIAILFTSTFVILSGGLVTANQFLSNATMLPRMFGSELIDGVYWTLAMELKFYLIVFFIILIGFQQKLTAVFISWPWFILFGWIIGSKNLPYAGEFYSFFAAGSLFAIIKEKKSLMTILSLVLACGLCIYDAAVNSSNIYNQTIITAIIAFFFVFFAFLNSKLGASLKLPFSKVLGSITYPLYLTHAVAGYIILSVFASDSNKYILFGIVFVGFCTIGYLLHVFIEVKTAFFWKGLFKNTIGESVDVLEDKIDKSKARTKKATIG